MSAQENPDQQPEAQPTQLGRESLKGMEPAEIIAAQKGGRLKALLTGQAGTDTGAFTPHPDAPGGGAQYASVSAWLRTLSPPQVRVAARDGYVPGVVPKKLNGHHEL